MLTSVVISVNICWIEKFVPKTVCSYHVMYAFKNESTLYHFLNVKELRARKRRGIWSLNNGNGTRPHNHLIRKQKINYCCRDKNWDIYCVWLSYAAPFCENFTKLYFNAENLEKRLIRVRGNFFDALFSKKYPFWPISNAALNF